MTTSDWVLIATALFLGAVALFVPLLSEIVKRKAFSPKIEIEFDLSPPFCHKTYWRSPADPTFEEAVFYFRLRIINTGKSQAKLCESVLEDLCIYDSADRPIKLTNFSPVNLRWSGGISSQYLNINPGRRIFCDIGHLSSPNYQAGGGNGVAIDIPGQHLGGLRFFLDLGSIPFSQPNCFLPGKYGIRVSLYSENALREDAFFVISWSGNWQDEEADMFRELVIEKVNTIIFT